MGQALATAQVRQNNWSRSSARCRALPPLLTPSGASTFPTPSSLRLVEVACQPQHQALATTQVRQSGWSRSSARCRALPPLLTLFGASSFPTPSSRRLVEVGYQPQHPALETFAGKAERLQQE